MAQRFAGKTVLITGGSSGIGFATAKRIVNEGGRVIITGRDEAKLKQAAAELGAQADYVRGDVSSLKEIDALYATVKQKYGHLDGLFANAGVANFNLSANVKEDEFDLLFDTNVKGLFFTLQKAVPLLVKGSSVVINASVAASRGTLSMSVYGASKAAARAFARSFANENVANGIRFNAVSPGPIETPIWGRGTDGASSGIDAADLAAGKEKKAQSNPMKRFGNPDEVAAAVAYLLSSESSYTTGSELFVDGGVNQL